MMVFEMLRWVGDIDGYLEVIDQRRLPAHFEMLKCKTTEQLYDAIKTLAVRGAPAIGVAAAFGICLAMQEAPEADLSKALCRLEESAEYLAASRPTAVNLFWALDRMKASAQKFVGENSDADLTALREALLREAFAICDEDKQMCRREVDKGQQRDIDTLQCRRPCNSRAGNGLVGSIRSPQQRQKV